MKPSENKEKIFRLDSDWYRKLSLIDLIKRIAELGDKHALEELHDNRSCFRIPDKGWGCLSDYLNHLRAMVARMKWKPGNAFEIADRAYDLALDKFNNLPKRSISENMHRSDVQLKRKGSNCRLYYKGFLRRLRRKLKNNPPKDPLE